jgi:hypothetical protein
LLWGRAEPFGEGGPESLGVLIAQSVPWKLFDPDTATSEETGHGLQGGFLGSTGPGSEPGEVDGHGVPIRIADGDREEVVRGHC